MKRSLLNKTLTPAEKAALFWWVMEGEKDWMQVYLAATGMTEDDLAKDNRVVIGQYMSKWKATSKVKNEIQRLKLIKENRTKDLQQQAYDEGRKSAFEESTDATDEEIRTKIKGITDYTDPKNQKDKLNEIINSARDPGDALDAIKVIISGQRNDQDAAKQNKIQRFYTPLQCRDCPIYLEKKESLKK